MTEPPVGVPHPPKANFMRKKVGGVPVLYIGGGAVLILAVYAYKTKKSAAAITAAAASPTLLDANGNPVPVDANGNPIDKTTLNGVFPAMPSGTVTGTPDVGSTPNTAIQTNDDWVKAGVAWLGTHMGVGGGTAQTALQAYLNGDQLSYVQGTYRDAVIKEYGLPPTLLPTGGTGPKPPSPVVTPPHIIVPPKPKPIHPPTKTNTPPKVPPVKLHRGGTAGGPQAYPGHQLQVGSTGGYVQKVQAAVGVSQDGIYGPATKAAVEAYQRRHGLGVDGVVGPLTWRTMYGPN